jgi:tyrosyl-tRNA synthetase
MEDPALRYGQKELASRVVEVLFGREAVTQAQKITEVLFGSEDKMELIKNMSKEDIEALAQETGWCSFSEESPRLLDICVQAGIAESNGEVKKLIQSGSIFINEIKAEDMQKTFSSDDFVNGILLLRKGKKTFKVVKK